MLGGYLILLITTSFQVFKQQNHQKFVTNYICMFLYMWKCKTKPPHYIALKIEVEDKTYAIKIEVET